MRRAFSLAAPFGALLVAAMASPFAASPVTAQAEAPATTTSVHDTLPPEVPPTQPTTVAETSVPVTTSVPTTTTTVPVSDPSDPTLAPVCGVAARGSGCRIIAYYGNPLSTRMGVLGATPPQQMLPALDRRLVEWRDADPATPTRCALELIAITAQASPGRSGLSRLRSPAEVIDRVVGWARGAGCLVILDIQVGWSTVAQELHYLRPWLEQPDVHLALDPEWALPAGTKPGSKIGSLDAADINLAITTLTEIVSTKQLSPKMLIVHRFRAFMVTNPKAIAPTPAVRLVVNMDGFGTPERKISSYRVALQGMPTTLTGFKLFTKIEKPMMRPFDVLPLGPAPVFINYQ